MSLNDHDYVNFSEDYELDYHLKNVNKRQTAENRKTLRILGEELKVKLGKKLLTHKEFKEYIIKNLHRLE